MRNGTSIVPPRNTAFVRSSFGWKWFTCVCLLLGALFRFVWLGDIEYKDDEDGMFHHSQAVGETQLWPTLGMTSGVRGIRHPALGIWSFGILAQVFRLHTPLALTGSVQALSLVAIVLLFWFAWRVVAIPQREVWLWTAALACTNLVAAVYARKIWVPNLLPILCVILLISWWHRQTAPGALLWGVTGAVLGQVHMSGFFHAAVMAIGTALFARANVRFSCAFRAQVQARCPLGLRTDCAHMQKSPHPSRACGRRDLGAQFGVYGMKARASPLVENADEIDDDVHPGQELTERAGVVHICREQLDGVKYAQPLAVRQISGGHADPVSCQGEPRDELRADEAAAPEHTDVQGP